MRSTALRRTDGMLALLRNRSRAEVSAVALGGGVLAATDGTAVSLFDVPHRRLAARLISPDGSDAVAVAVSRNGYLAAVAFGGDVMLHDLSSRSTVRLDGRVTALAFSPDGALLAGAGPRQLRVWDNDGRTLHEDTLPRARAGVAADVGFDEQGRSLTEIRGGRLTVVVRGALATAQHGAPARRARRRARAQPERTARRERTLAVARG